MGQGREWEAGNASGTRCQAHGVRIIDISPPNCIDQKNGRRFPIEELFSTIFQWINSPPNLIDQKKRQKPSKKTKILNYFFEIGIVF